MALTDWKELCERLVEVLELCPPPRGWEIAQPDLLASARAALVEPVAAPAWPTSQQLKTFACVWWKNFSFTKDKATCTWVINEINPEHFVDFSRDLLARYGHQPAPPVEGEVG